MKKILLSLVFVLLVIAVFAQNSFDRWVPTSGTNTYTTNITAFTSYNNSQVYVRFGNANSASSTLAINGLAAIPIRLWDGDSWELVTTGQIPANSNAILTYDNTNGYYKAVIFENIGGNLEWGDIDGTLSDQTDLQSALNLKANLASPTFTGTVVLPSTTSIGTVTNTEISYVDGVTSAIQTQINGKQDAFTSQNANSVYSGPATGSPASPTFRSLARADLPITGTPNGTKFLRDDLSWQTVSGGSISGLTAGRVVVATGATSVGDDSNFTFDTSTDDLVVDGSRQIKLSGVLYPGLAIGNGAGYTSTLSVADGGNLAIGTDALSSITETVNFYDASYNSAIGYQAGDNLTTGRENTFIGFNAGKTVTTGNRNTYVGSKSGNTGVTTAIGNTALGALTLRSVTTGDQNTAIGDQAGGGITTGSKNIIIGPTVAVGTGSNNLIVGSESFETITSQSGNVGLGHWAGVYAKGAQNTFVGFQSCGQAINITTDINYNTFVGTDAGNDATNYAYDLDYSTFIGAFAGLGSTTQASYSTAIGARAKVYSSNSMVFGGETAPYIVNYGFGGESYASGLGVVYVKNATTNPSGNPSNGFILYSNGGVATLLNASGSAIDIGATWKLTGTSTLTGVATITSNTANQHVFNGTWTSTANNQVHANFTGTFTSRATAADALSAYKFSPTFVMTANNQVLSAIDIRPTFTVSSGVGFDTNAMYSTASTNTLYNIRHINTSNGSAAYSGIILGNDTGVTAAGFFLTSSGNTAYGGASSFNIINVNSASLTLGTGNSVRLLVAAGGNIMVGTATPTARLHISAGTATANTAPLKLTSGTNLTTAEAGAFEYNGTNLFFTRTGTTRENIITTSAVNSVSPTAPNRTLTVVIDGTTYYIHAKTTND